MSLTWTEFFTCIAIAIPMAFILLFYVIMIF